MRAMTDAYMCHDTFLGVPQLILIRAIPTHPWFRTTEQETTNRSIYSIWADHRLRKIEQAMLTEDQWDERGIEMGHDIPAHLRLKTFRQGGLDPDAKGVYV